MDDMNDSGSWAQASKCYEQLKIVDDMNDIWVMSLRLKVIWIAIGSEWHERLWVLSSRLWTLSTTKGYRRHEALYIMSLGLWMQSTSLGCGSHEWLLVCELRALHTMYRSRLSMTWKTPGHELKALDAMNSLGLWKTWKTWVHELWALYEQIKVVVDMNFEWSSQAFRSYGQLRARDDMCYSCSLAQGSLYYA